MKIISENLGQVIGDQNTAYFGEASKSNEGDEQMTPQDFVITYGKLPEKLTPQEIAMRWIEQHKGEEITFQKTYLHLVSVGGLLEQLGIIEKPPLRHSESFSPTQ